MSESLAWDLNLLFFSVRRHCLSFLLFQSHFWQPYSTNKINVALLYSYNRLLLMRAHTMKLIPLWSSTGAEDSLYDEVAPSSSDNTPLSNNDLSVPDTSADEDKRLSAASGYYELVEVKHEVPTVDGNYTGIVDEGPRPKSSSSGRAEPVHVDSSSTLACPSSAVIDSNGTVEGEDEDGAPHYEIVTPRRTEKKVSKTTHVAWI